MAVELTIKIYREEEGKDLFVAQCQIDKDEIIAGHGTHPYTALYELIHEMEMAEYFRADNE